MDYIDERYFKAVNKFEENGFEVTQGSNSNTEYGHSRYFYVNKNNESQDNSGLGFQVRVSDHSVLSNRRLSETQILNDGDIDSAYHKINYWFNPKEYANKNVVVKKQSKIEVPEEKLMDTDVILNERLAKTGRKIYNVERTYEFDAFIPTHIESGFALPLKMKNPDVRFEDGGLIAPNGKKSNLTPEQYKLVRTKAFKDWFGDWENDPANASKVVDENGEPLVVYRGMPKKRRVGNIFRYNVNLFGTKGVGGRQTNFFSFYFTDIKKVAENYGENLSEEDGGYVVKPYFLNVRNLFQAFTRKNEYELTFQKLYDIANKTGKPIYEKNYKGEIETDFRGNKIEWKDQSYEWRNQYDSPQLQETFIYFVDWNKNQANQWFWRNYLQQYLNYDGLVFYETSQNRVWDKNDKVKPLYGDEFSKTFGVFEPNQIKLADGSNTTFDGSNLDIRYADGGSVKRYNKEIMNKVKENTLIEGKEYSGKLVKSILKKASFDNTDFFEYIDNNDVYVYRQVDVNNLYAKDSTLATFVDTSKGYFQDNKNDYRWELQYPIVVGDTDWEKGVVLDGYHRITQAITNNDNKLYAFVKQPKNETDKHFHYQFEQGGQTKEIMKKVKKGGITYGKSHAEGGIPVKNASTGDMLEVEGGEGIVNKRSMASGKKVKLNGQEMTICEAVSQLNQMEGGVSFSCDDVEDMQFIEEMALGGELERGVRTEKEHIQVLKDLYSKRITPNEATRKIAEDHLKEDERYYSKLAKMEGKMAKGGSVSTLLAPNGKPSNLNAEQYHLVRTPEFKAWFGDWEKLAMAKVKDPAMDEVTLANLSKDVSKVVDQNGEPLVVYHGTKTRGEQGIFSIFNLEKSGESNKIAKVGFWFTPLKSFAENFAYNSYWGKNAVFIYDVFLSIKNPKIYITDDAIYGDSYEKLKTDIYAIEGQSQERANIGGIGYALKNEKQTIDNFREKLLQEGFDGILIKNTRYDRKEAGGNNDQYVAFFSNNIKLANGNNTTFDGSNPDIRFENGGETDEDNLSYTEAQERWNKKAGIPSQKEALAFVKENPEILAMLKNGGEIMDCGCGSYGNGGYVDTFVDERIVSKVEDKDNPFAKFGLKKNFRGDTFVRLDAIEEKSINFCDSFPQVCGKNMGILREDMPQIYEEYIPEYLDFLKDMGVDAKLEYDIPVKELTATQEDISVPRMSRMLKRLLSGYYIDSDGNRINPLKRKLIITKDNYVLDGHHRWATMYFLSPNNTIDALRVNADIKDIVPISKNFGMVQFQKFMYGGKVGVTGFTDIDGLDANYNPSMVKYLKITRNIFPKAGLKISPLITYNDDNPPKIVFSENGFQIEDIGKRNLKFNTLRDIKSLLSIDVNDAIADYNLSIPDKDKQIFLENVSYSTTLEDGLFAVRRVLTSVNQIDTPAISILFYQYKSASITFSFIFNDKFIELYGDDLDVLEAILNGFSQAFKNSYKMDALVIEGNFTRSRKPRTAKSQPQQPTQNEWYWRFKTEKELKDEYGDNWMDSISWSSNMNDLLGGEIVENRLSKDFIEEAKLIGKAYTNTVDVLGLPIGANSKNWYATIPFKVLTNKPLPSQQTATQQGGYWRFKTEQELIDELGSNWGDIIPFGWSSRMNYLLGQKIDNNKLVDGKPISGTEIDTLKTYGITSGERDTGWAITQDLFKFVPSTTQAPTQQAGYWRFKTKQELEDEYGDNWINSFNVSNAPSQISYLLGQKIDNDKLGEDGKPKVSPYFFDTKNQYGITSGGDDEWIIDDQRLFKFVPETTQQTSNSQLIPTKELDKKIQEVQDLMNSELFSPDEVVVQQVLIDELKNLNDQKQKSILSNYYSNDLNDLLQLYAQNISKGQRLTMDVACGKETPSGMPSELDETQYTLVRTPQFKAWFGDWEEAYKTKNYSGVSKAINEKTGEPLVVYHGKGNMKVEATYFKLTGFPIKYFAENKSYSEWFKNNYNAVNILYEFFINVSNPIDLSMVGLDEITPQTFVDLIEALYDYKIQTPLMMPDRAVKVWQILRGNPKMLTEIKEKTNYDGFIIFENNPQDIVNGEENITKDFIAYENNQYKSADGRNTTFFMDVEDFRFEKGGVTQHTL